jgi:hypothetical protein
MIGFVSASVSKGDLTHAELRMASSSLGRDGQKVYSTDLIVWLLNRFDPDNNEFSS